MNLIRMSIVILFVLITSGNSSLLDLFSTNKSNSNKDKVSKVETLQGIINQNNFYLVIPNVENKIDMKKKDFNLFDSDNQPLGFEIDKRFNDDYTFVRIFSDYIIPEKRYTLKFKKEFKYANGNIISFDTSNSFIISADPLIETEFYIENSINTETSGKIKIDFNGQVIKSKNIRDFISFDKNVEYSYKIVNSILEIYGDFKPSKTYQITLKKGFIVGFKMNNKDLTKEVVFGDVKPSLSFKNENSYISSYSDAIEIESTNIDSVNVNIFRVNDLNVSYLNIFKSYMLSDDYYNKPYYYDEYSELVSSYKFPMKKERNKKNNFFIDFNQQLKKSNDGIYLIKISNEDSDKEITKLVYKSDLGISTKIAKNQMFFSIRSLANNSPIKDAEVYVYSKKNKLILKSTTNSDGILNQKYQNIIAEKPKLVIVKKEEKINFLNLDSSISKYDILNDRSDSLKSNYSALVFMERTLLRPSDKVNMLITVKDKTLKSLQNESVYVEIYDPKSKLIKSDELKLNEVGIVDYSFTSYNEYKTGKYRINVLLGDVQIGTKEFYVEAFISEKIEVLLDVEKDKFLISDDIDVNLQSNYLFGAPAKNLKYKFETIASPSSFKSIKFSEFSFKDILSNQRDLLVNDVNQEGLLDNTGHKKLNLTIPFEKTTYSEIKTSLISTVFDDGRPVRKYKDVKIYPYEKIVGIKSNFKNNAKRDKKISFSTILVNPLSEKVLNNKEKLSVKIYKEFWHYYANDEIREIESFEINSGDKFDYMPTRSGYHYVAITTAEGQTSTLKFYVSGWGNDPVKLKDKSSYKISIKSNKEIFNPGDIINLDIKSPIKGKLLITIEESEILDYKLIDMNTTTDKISIKLPSNIKKGAYIKAHLVRSTKESDKVFPFRVSGKTYIKLNNSHKNSNSEIVLNTEYKSKDSIDVKVKAVNSPNAYAVISLVDKGILNIVNEKNTDAFEFYNQPEKDTVSLYDLYSDLQQHIQLYSESVSGDGITKKRNRHNSPDAINQRVKPVSFWSKIIRLDENGMGSYTFKPKNFNGQLRAQVLVVDNNKISSDTKYTIVKDDLVIKPTFPRFLIQDDEAIVPVRIINTTNKLNKFRFDIQTTNNLKVENMENILSLNSKESQVYDIKIKALKPGSSKIIMKAIDNNYTYTKEINLYIKDKYDYKVISKFGVLNKNEEANINILDKDMKMLNTSINAFVSIDDSPFSKLSKSSKYLIGYPYGCAEQTSSKVLAMLLSEKFIDKNDKKTLRDRTKFIKEGVKKLVSMQNNNGHFTYWSGGTYVNKFASFYTMYVLQMVKDRGFEVPSSTIKNALSAHWDLFKNDSRNLDFFMAYADENMTNKIYDNNSYGNTLTSYVALAVAMKRYGNISEAQNLINKANNEYLNYDMNKSRSYSDSFYSPIKDVASSLFLYSKFMSPSSDDKFAKNLIRTVNSYIEQNKLYSTQDKAFSMLAVESYYKDIGLDDSKIDVNLSYDNQLNNITSKLYKEIKIEEKNAISLRNNGSVVNYTIDINKPIDLIPNKDQIDKSKNIFISSNIINKNHEIVDLNNIQLGEKLFIEVKLYSNKTIENVAVNVQVPAGIEIINPRLYKNSDNLKKVNYNPDYEDYRDDRMLTFLTTSYNTTKFLIPITAVTKGEFTYPSTYIEAMYDSRINNYYKPAYKVTIK